ncbi:MAG TPA: S-layer homology domain-containing protein [Syntrophomonadaceae bacterium]|nr:S-layer homology domain-containing protein [Syntrophomonadaceae bacterium]
MYFKIAGRHRIVMSICLCLALLQAYTVPVTASETASDSASAADQQIQTGNTSFADLPPNNSLYPYVHYLQGKNIISGFPDGSFRPTDSITRAQAAQMNVQTKGLTPATGGQTFSDVPTEYWAYGAIEAATKTGLFAGYPDGTFKPDGQITRAEAITLLMKLSGGALSDKTIDIKDLPADHWAYRPVATAVQAGLVELSASNCFQPDGYYQRGEMAKSLARLFTLSPVLRSNVLPGELVVKSGTVIINGATMEGTIKVKAGDVITTGTNCQAQISFDDGSSLLIKPNTELAITTARGFNYMKQDGTAGVAVDKLIVSLKKGNIFGALATPYESDGTSAYEEDSGSAVAWWNEPYAHRTRVEVDMPRGVCEIKGTFWNSMVNANGQGSTSLLTGSAEVTSSGQTVSLAPGQSTIISSPGQPPSPPAVITPAQIQEWSQVQQWVATTAQQIQNNVPQPPIVAGPGNPPQPPNVVEVISQALNQAVNQAVNQAPTPPPTNYSGGGSPTVDAVTADPASGAVMAFSQSVSLTTTTSSATIMYTVDGTDPNWTNGILYTGPISVTGPVTIKAIALMSGYDNSPISTFSYTITQAPPSAVLADPHIVLPNVFATSGGVGVSGAKLFACRINLTGEDASISASVYAQSSIQLADFDIFEVYIDLNDNGILEANEQVTADGSDFSINNGGAITFTAQEAQDHTLNGVQIAGLKLTTSQSTHDIILVGNVKLGQALTAGENVTFSITNDRLSIIGVTSQAVISATGGPVDGTQHIAP